MNLRYLTGASLIASAVLIAGCSKPDTTTTADTNTVRESTVTREEVRPAEPAAPTPAPAQAVIQTQPGPQGSQVALNKVAVTGDVMTIQLTYSGLANPSHPNIDEISIIDDATAKQLGVLKDNAGKWLAAPKGVTGKSLDIFAQKTATIVWFKTPAPPATSKTVSINIPEVAPFDGVPVTR